MISFSEWLSKHSQLVRTIRVTSAHRDPDSEDQDIHGLQQDVHYRAVHKLLQQSLQLAALGSTPRTALEHGAAAATASASAAAAQQRCGLRLVSFSSRCEKPGAVGVLAALPAHSLTSLHLSVEHTGTVDCRGLSAALARLSCLQQLQLVMWPFASYVEFTGGSCLDSVSQLSKLTALQVEGEWCEELELRQLLSHPLQLRQLHLDRCCLGTSPLDLRSMSQLVDLKLTRTALKEGLALPSQLQELQLQLHLLDTPQLLSAVMPLQQLQRPRLHQDFSEHQPLLQLAQLPALQHLALSYDDIVTVQESWGSWAHLPQLRELHISYGAWAADPHFGTWPEDLAAILGGVAACSNLTKLHLEPQQKSAFEGDAEHSTRGAVAACGKLAALKTLKDLCFKESSRQIPMITLLPGDARALTALTGLTRLVLRALGSGVGDVAATALACSLRQLRHLDLHSCNLGDMVCLAAIGQLTQLTALHLCGNEVLTREGLMLLTGLTRLQQLGVRRNVEVTDAVVEEFWAAVREQ
jgi:hypothetical protein